MLLLQWAWAEKTVQGVETHWLFCKKMFPTQQSEKMVMLTAFWHMKGSMAIDFREIGALKYSALYCQLLSQNSLYSLYDLHIICGCFELILEATSCSICTDTYLPSHKLPLRDMWRSTWEESKNSFSTLSYGLIHMDAQMG